MRFTKIVSLQPSPLMGLFRYLLFLFIFLSCGDGGADFAFPEPKAGVWCTYNVSFNVGTSQVEMEKQKQQMENDVERGTVSTDPRINCVTNGNWVQVDDLHWQFEVTIECFRASDTSRVPPPSGTKPPPGRVSDGTVKKSGCPEDDIKK